MKYYVSNPARPGARRAVEITDRAKRYRAQKNAPPSKRCYLCGAPGPRDVEHIDGRESNNNPKNLDRACRQCNAKKSHNFKRRGAGIRTKQYNPEPGAGAKTLAQYVTAAMVLRGMSDAMPLQSAIDLMHNTPASARSRFAQQIWDKRRASMADVPF